MRRNVVSSRNETFRDASRSAREISEEPKRNWTTVTGLIAQHRGRGNFSWCSDRSRTRFKQFNACCPPTFTFARQHHRPGRLNGAVGSYRSSIGSIKGGVRWILISSDNERDESFLIDRNGNVKHHGSIHCLKKEKLLVYEISLIIL